MTPEPAPDEVMTADAFLRWASARDRGHFELLDGRVRSMAPERVEHAVVKAETWLALREAIDRLGLPCRAYLDGLGLRIDSRNLFVPDVMVACGAKPEPDAMELPDPVIVVEVLSPSTSAIDMSRKLDAYLRHPTVRHYLLIDIDRLMVVHHAKAEDGRIATALLRDGSMTLDPPGLTVEVAALFARL